MSKQKYAGAVISDEYGRFLLTSEYAKIGICTPKMALSVETFLCDWEGSIRAIKEKIKHQLGVIDVIEFNNSISFTGFGQTLSKSIDIYMFKIHKNMEFKIRNFVDNPVLFKSLSEIKVLTDKNVIELSVYAKKALSCIENS